MKTYLEISKIRATILYILKNFEEGIDYIKLFKIMYFAQQYNLIKYGKPVFNETFHALKHGPVPSFTYKCIQILDGRKEPIKELEEFNKSFKVNNSKVFKIEEPDMDELSKSDIKSINKAIKECKDIDSYDLSALSHDKAWKDAYKRAQDDPEKDRMSLIEIAKSGKASEDIIEYIRNKEQLKRVLSF